MYYRYNRGERDKKVLAELGVAVALLILCIAGFFFARQPGSEVVPVAATGPAITASPEPTPIPTPEPKPEDGVTTYFQGPKAWSKKMPYSGSWGKLYIDGSSFGGFGCGLCCMANIYCTLTDYTCSPVDMYRYAKKHSGYGGGGAISWECMEMTMNSLGFESRLETKPETYQEFKEKIKQAESTIVLVSSYNDDSYWQNTPGHYVTIFLYDDAKESVFLGDSGDLKHNRSFVPLKTLYKALKTSSPKQFMTVSNYRENKNKWKWDKVTEKYVPMS